MHLYFSGGRLKCDVLMWGYAVGLLTLARVTLVRVTLARLPIEDENERRRAEERRRGEEKRSLCVSVRSPLLRRQARVTEAGTCHVRIHITCAHEKGCRRVQGQDKQQAHQTSWAASPSDQMPQGMFLCDDDQKQTNKIKKTQCAFC